MKLLSSADQVKLSVNPNSFSPEFKLTVVFEYHRNLESPPMNVSGVLKLDNKTLSRMHEFTNNTDECKTIHSPFSFGENSNDQNLIKRKKEETDSLYTELYIPLSEQALNAIEKHREKNQNEVIFSFDFIVTYFSKSNLLNNQYDEFNKRRAQISSHHIHQSDWVKNFAPQLGMGNFLLLEFPLINPVKITDDFFLPLQISQEGFMKTLTSMKSNLLKGEWHSVLMEGRKFIEYLYKPDEPVKECLVSLFQESGKLSDKSFNDFSQIIRNVHSLTSASVHSKDVQKTYIDPVFHREDAYFVYSLCISLANSILTKLDRKQYQT